IATSAFGLGIDYSSVRSVVHACLPETVDRWYQEVGRGGRDGHASTALLLPAVDDAEIAASLGIKMLTPEVAARRWHGLWRSRQQRQAVSYVDLHTITSRGLSGSYNRRWNSQLLRGLEELGQIRRWPVSRWQAEELELPWPEDTEHDWERVE